jgi:heterodisulfide reductase subunit C
MSKIEIRLSTLRQQVEEGWKKAQLAEHYGISVLEMGKHLKNAGLKIRKFKEAKATLINDEIDSTSENLHPAVEEFTGIVEEARAEVQETVEEEVNWEN